MLNCQGQQRTTVRLERRKKSKQDGEREDTMKSKRRLKNKRPINNERLQRP